MTLALDSNVFISFLSDPDEFYDSSKAIIEAITSGDIQAVCSSIVFGEIVYTTRDPESIVAVDAFFASLTHCTDIPADKIICRKAASLRQKYPVLKLPDALHLATAIVSKADRFITADKRLLAIAQKETKSVFLKGFVA